jgi:4-hydroxybenzoate polyprenyltransferase
MGVQALIAFAVLLTFHPTAIWLGLASLALVAVYPFAKRFTWWPQVFLGLAFNWGALLAWAAKTGTVEPAPVALYIGGIAWTLFYDTIYAHQDKEDDALIGVKSTARLFGAATARWLSIFLVISVTMLGLAAILALAPGGNMRAMVIALAGVWAFGWHLLLQLRQLDTEDPLICLRLFRSNRNTGLILTLFFAGALFV